MQESLSLYLFKAITCVRSLNLTFGRFQLWNQWAIMTKFLMNKYPWVKYAGHGVVFIIAQLNRADPLKRIVKKKSESSDRKNACFLAWLTLTLALPTSSLFFKLLLNISRGVAWLVTQFRQNWISRRHTLQCQNKFKVLSIDVLSNLSIFLTLTTIHLSTKSHFFAF